MYVSLNYVIEIDAPTDATDGGRADARVGPCVHVCVSHRVSLSAIVLLSQPAASFTAAAQQLQPQQEDAAAVSHPLLATTAGRHCCAQGSASSTLLF
jgi:hypothetical protein